MTSEKVALCDFVRVPSSMGLACSAITQLLLKLISSPLSRLNLRPSWNSNRWSPWRLKSKAFWLIESTREIVGYEPCGDWANTANQIRIDNVYYPIIGSMDFRVYKPESNTFYHGINIHPWAEAVLPFSPTFRTVYGSQKSPIWLDPKKMAAPFLKIWWTLLTTWDSLLDARAPRPLPTKNFFAEFKRNASKKTNGPMAQWLPCSNNTFCLLASAASIPTAISLAIAWSTADVSVASLSSRPSSAQPDEALPICHQHGCHARAHFLHSCYSSSNQLQNGWKVAQIAPSSLNATEIFEITWTREWWLVHRWIHLFR